MNKTYKGLLVAAVIMLVVGCGVELSPKQQLIELEQKVESTIENYTAKILQAEEQANLLPKDSYLHSIAMKGVKGLERALDAAVEPVQAKIVLLKAELGVDTAEQVDTIAAHSNTETLENEHIGNTE